jgi:hypothetical protein
MTPLLLVVLMSLVLGSCDEGHAPDTAWVQAHSARGMPAQWVRGIAAPDGPFIPPPNGPYNTHGASIFWPECPAFYDSRLRLPLLERLPTPPQ